MKKFSILLLIVLVLVSVSSFRVFALLPLSGKLILIDIGHGGKDPGTISNGILEKDLNLAIGKKLETELVKKGASVILTRDGDYDLSNPKAERRKQSDFDNRIKLINNSKADMYLSIHINYLEDASYKGGQVFYYKTEKNKNIALSIQEELNKISDKREVKKTPNIYMYQRLKVPGVLVECGFLSNAVERQNLITEGYQEKVAKAISNGVANYYK